jgi:hypothetical protein
LKIAIIIYRCIKNSAGMMLNNETEYYMQQWNYIKTRQAKTRKLDDLFSCSVVSMSVTNHRGHELLKNITKYNKV